MLFNLFADSSTRRRPSASSPRRTTRTRRPMVEGLEDRKLLTGFILGNSFTTPEGTGSNHQVDFTISLALASSTEVSVQYKTMDYAAVAGSDYIAASGTVTFAPGETSKQVPVTIIGDSAVEKTESFYLSLSSPTNGIVMTPLLGCSIIDDDTAMAAAVSINDTSAFRGFDGTQSMAFTVSLNAPATSNVSVTATTADLTAIAGVDYQATSKVLNFAPGQQTQQFIVPIIGALVPTTDKVFTVSLSNTSATLTRATGAGIIKSGDGVTLTPVTQVTAPPVAVAPSQITIGDVVMTRGLSGTKSMVFNVSLDQPAINPVSVTASTANLTAIAGVDYQTTSQVLNFAPGQKTQQFIVPVIGTSVPTSTEVFIVNLTNPSLRLFRSAAAGLVTYGA